jgi:antitoxin component YwqK of YwqJK toxin-antitoxin module
MEADFMEQRARLHNKFFWIWTVLTAAIPCCRPRIADKPAAFFNAQEHRFMTKAGVAYMDDFVFTGNQVLLYEDGDTASVVPYTDGRENGIAVYRYPGGQIKEEREFKQGRKTGTHKGWWSSGKLRFSYSFNNDVYDGEVKDWYESGQPFKSFHYNNGVEEGMQQQYFSNGALQFNYEARNGRQFGLTGIKNCVNVRDSIALH